MLSAKTGFAVPEKILNRSSFTTLALQCDRSAIARVQTSFPGADSTNEMDTKRRCGCIHEARRLTCVTHQTSVPIARDCLANEGLIARKPCSGSARHRWAR